MANPSVSIFGAPKATNALDVLRETLTLDLVEREKVVSFATERGRGTASMEVPIGDFAEVCETIAILANTKSEEEDLSSLSPAEMIRRTWKVSEGEVSFRIKSGRGNRSIKVPIDQIHDVAEFLVNAIEPIENASAKLDREIARMEAAANKAR